MPGYRIPDAPRRQVPDHAPIVFEDITHEHLVYLFAEAFIESGGHAGDDPRSPVIQKQELPATACTAASSYPSGPSAPPHMHWESKAIRPSSSAIVLRVPVPSIGSGPSSACLTSAGTRRGMIVPPSMPAAYLLHVFYRNTRFSATIPGHIRIFYGECPCDLCRRTPRFPVYTKQTMINSSAGMAEKASQDRCGNDSAAA